MKKLEEARKLMAKAGVNHAEQQHQLADRVMAMFPNLGWTRNDVVRLLDEEYRKSLERKVWTGEYE